MNRLRIIPPQKKGARSETHYAIHTPSEQNALQVFQNARLNLLNVNYWHALADNGTRFQLMDEKGNEVNSLVKQGNYFRITIPGVPSSPHSDGAEWVRVEQIEEGKLRYHEFTAIRVRPAIPPFLQNSQSEPMHFFSKDATSSFCVVRNSTRVTASVIGRNETPNTKTGNVFNFIRNLIVSTGAILGFSKKQWRCLTKGIIRKKGALIRV